MRGYGVLVIGHRGSRSPGPDNTATAVAAALAAGAAGVELDVRRGGDGVLRCSHDPFSAEAQPPPLTSVLAVAHGVVVLEIKNVPGEPDYDAPAEWVAQELVRTLAAGPAGSFEVVISSFDWLAVEAVRALDGPPTAFLAPPGVALAAATRYARDGGHAEVHAHLSDVLAAGAVGVAASHEAGLRVAVWTVTDLDLLPALASWQVDAAICDDPAGAVRRLSS